MSMHTFAKSTNLSKLVLLIYSNKYDEAKLTEFVNIVQKISLSYLHYQEVSGRYIRFERNKDTGELEDLALDCIAGLFIRNEKGEFIQLRKYFKQNSTNLAQLDNTEVLVLLKRLVIKKTKQELCRIFKERDPEAAKIVRNIRRTIQSASDIDSFKDKGREYICYSHENHKHYIHRSVNGKNVDETLSASYLRKTQPPIPEKFLLSEYLISFSRRDRVPTCLRKMLEVLKDDERYQNYLPLNMAVRIICSVNAEIAHEKFISLNTNFSPLDELHLKEIENRKNSVSKKIKRKIEKHYVKTYKISDAKGIIYHKALADMLEDICQGNDCDSHFTHLKRNMPQLSQSTYQNQERTIFEYLVKLTKRWYRESLIELL